VALAPLLVTHMQLPWLAMLSDMLTVLRNQSPMVNIICNIECCSVLNADAMLDGVDGTSQVSDLYGVRNLMDLPAASEEPVPSLGCRATLVQRACTGS